MRSRAGFTLIELMIVVVILGILAAIAIPKFNQISKAAKEAEAGPILKQLYTLQERYVQQYDTYASDVSQLEGGAGNVANAVYYDFDLGTDPTGYLVCATPKDPSIGLRTFGINGNRVITQGC